MQAPKVVLFVGHHKVGSTALQEFLSSNAIALLKSGLLYPMVEAEGMSYLLRAAIEGTDIATGNINLREPHNALAFRMLAEDRPRGRGGRGGKMGKVPPYHAGVPGSDQMFRSIRKQIEIFKPDTVVLCAEVFANFAAKDPRLIQKLLEVFPGSEIEVIATLRRPDEYLASWHGQRFRFGHKLEALREDALEGYYAGIHFDYRLMLEAWIDAVGIQNVKLRNYRVALSKGGAIPDFIDAAGLTLPGGLRHDIISNPSIRYCQFEIARQAMNEIDRASARAVIDMLEDLSKVPGLQSNEKVEMFGAQNRAAIVEHFAPINAWLGEQIGKPAFFDDLDQILTERPVPELDAAREALEVMRKQAEAVEKLPPAARKFLATAQI